ncbi:MAG: OmpA family protein [Muribaculaceae bacterium]|nr:OmpA family protein [Muribaculaceae bacterium]
MKHKLYILSVALMASAVSSDAFAYVQTSRTHPGDVTELIYKPSVSYNNDVIESDGLKGNWFIGADGGINAFLCTPMGCNDLGGRIKGQFGINVGKWFTPTVGSRLSFNGYWLSDPESRTQTGWGVSSEILWNLTNTLYGNHDKTRFGLIPYLGVGMLHNRQAHTNPFTLSYGVIAQYGLTSRLKLNLELGCKTTFSDFDGFGTANRFGGDNILSMSAGVSFTLGKTGFRKVIDARPVMLDNSRLRELCLSLSDKNDRLSRKSANDDRTVAELKKILEIEGLLSRYGNIFNNEYDNDSSACHFPVNDYSGLNSLRARLKGANNGCRPEMLKNTEGLYGIEAETGRIDNLINSEDADSISELEFDDNSKVTSVLDGDNYQSLIQSGKKCLGSPILFFFNIGTANLTDRSQLINLDEIARVVKQYGLHLRITGAADSETGTGEINHRLGNDRANYIISQLRERGISTSLITKINQGGIDHFNPGEANRHCKIELFITAR